jgi:hypothetical protein
MRVRDLSALDHSTDAMTADVWRQPLDQRHQFADRSCGVEGANRY